ncbi:MAG: hypothetical protein VB858_04070, partial [Planctomycetaceae bacterium]
MKQEICVTQEQENCIADGLSRTRNLVTVWLLAGIVSLHGIVGSADGSETWLQWRGPQRTGILDSQVWPDSLQKETLKTTWRVALGPSYSGPLVTADRIFVTETRAKKQEVVVALDRKTGSEIWSTSWPGAMS